MKIATQLSRIKAQNTIELSFSAPWEPKQKPNIRVQLFFSFPLSIHVSRHPNGKVGFQLSYAFPPVPKEPNKLKPETKTRERERERERELYFVFHSQIFRIEIKTLTFNRLTWRSLASPCWASVMSLWERCGGGEWVIVSVFS